MSHHIIYKQTATIEIAKQQQASKLHEEISDVLRYELPALLEPLFDALAGNDEIIRIDTLQIDLGLIPGPDFKNQFKQQLASQIEEAVTNSKKNAGNDDNITIIRTQQSGLEAFFYFLEFGTKPWFVTDKTIQEWERSLAGEFTGSHWQKIAVWLRSKYSQVIVERLVNQFSNAMLEKLVPELSSFSTTEWKAVYDDLLTVFSRCTGKRKASLETLLWKHSFIAFIKNGNSSNTLYNIAEVAWKQQAPSGDMAPVEPGNLQTSLRTETVREIIKKLAANKKDELAEQVKTNSKNEAPVQDNADIKELADKSDKDINSVNDIIAETTAPTYPDDKKTDVETGQKTEGDNAVKLFAEEDVAVTENISNKAEAGNVNEEGITGSAGEDDKLVRDKIFEDKTGRKNKTRTIIENEPQYVNNCGVIILHPFLQACFDELGLIKEKAFVNIEACRRAILLLHFLATGETEVAEYNLLLQKLLCGLPLEETLPGKLDITDMEKEESEKLLQSVINYWPPLKNTSLAGLRNTFLQREGKLEKKESGWLLRIEQKTVDVLLDKLPWGFSTIRLPWMDEMISVEWC